MSTIIFWSLLIIACFLSGMVLGGIQSYMKEDFRQKEDYIRRRMIDDNSFAASRGKPTPFPPEQYPEIFTALKEKSLKYNQQSWDPDILEDKK